MHPYTCNRKLTENIIGHAALLNNKGKRYICSYMYVHEKIPYSYMFLDAQHEW